MRKKVRSFRQHTRETCGIACILMLLDYYRRVQYPTRKMELNLYQRYRSRAFRGLPGSFAADCLSKNGLQVELLHSAPEYMENREDYYEEALYTALLREYKSGVERCAHRVTHRRNVELDSEVLKTQLSEGKLVMVQCIVPGDADGIHTHTLHWVLVYGWDAEGFLVCDPNFGKCRIPEEEMEGYMDAPVGRLFLTVREGQ